MSFIRGQPSFVNLILELTVITSFSFSSKCGDVAFDVSVFGHLSAYLTRRRSDPP